MFNQLFETLFRWYSSGTKYGYKPKRGEFKAILYYLGDVVLLTTLMTHREIMAVASPVLLAGVAIGSSVVIALGNILLLNRAGIIKNLLLIEFLSLMIFLSFLCAMALLFINNKLGIIV
jgi:hypothetical protein